MTATDFVGIRPEHAHFLPESARTATRDGRPSAGPVPLRGLLISAGALVVAVLVSTFFGDSIEASQDLVWSLAIIPALLLAYHRGWKRVTLWLAAALALLWSTYVVGYTFSLPLGEWPAFLPVISAYIAISLGSGWFSEVQANVEELKAKERELQEAYVVLQASHEAHKSAQLQLIHAEKLESVGLLAAGVAHEVKNPLMTLLTGVQYLRTFAPPEEDDVKQLLDDMWLAVRRADSVIKGLLDYSRARELFLKEENVNELVDRTLQFVKHECDKKRINVKRDFGQELPRVTMDGYKVQQVLVNLFTNATHAMSDGGSLTVRTTHGTMQPGAESSAEAHGVWDTDGMPAEVVVEIQDTGPGIPEESLTKIFDPFFTTKPTGQGTGLGLAVSRQIMEMHGGTLDIQNSDLGVRARLVFRPETEGA
jgi:signal transduction histidine kinase